MKQLKIRAHHLFCMLLFSGKGYDEKFSQNMNGIVCKLRNNPEQSLILLREPDDICSCCPNLLQGECILGNEDVINKDETVLSGLKLEEGKEYTYKEILDVILNSKISEIFKNCCGDCRWHGVGLCSCGQLVENCRTYSKG
ncbi:MAG: DUF1284 domain-containing protein [Oscillospiraceae bacterium]|nr:DUF1284 domain-containing protein [Oscillospiraceae bacterium]